MKKAGLVFLVLIISVLVIFAGNSNAATVLIPVAEFTEDGQTNADAVNYFKDFQGGFLQGKDSWSCFVAPVRIPGNATKINKVTVYFKDLNPAPVVAWFTLDAVDMAAGTTDNYVDYSLLNGTDIVQAFDLPLSHKALVKGRVYQLGTCLQNDHYLYGAKVVYSVP
jgi:hypothetical protein